MLLLVVSDHSSPPSKLMRSPISLPIVLRSSLTKPLIFLHPLRRFYTVYSHPTDNNKRGFFMMSIHFFWRKKFLSRQFAGRKKKKFNHEVHEKTRRDEFAGEDARNTKHAGLETTRQARRAAFLMPEALFPCELPALIVCFRPSFVCRRDTGAPRALQARTPATQKNPSVISVLSAFSIFLPFPLRVLFSSAVQLSYSRML
jgi:hypothetical protein